MGTRNKQQQSDPKAATHAAEQGAVVNATKQSQQQQQQQHQQSKQKQPLTPPKTPQQQLDKKSPTTTSPVHGQAALTFDLPSPSEWNPHNSQQSQPQPQQQAQQVAHGQAAGSGTPPSALFNDHRRESLSSGLAQQQQQPVPTADDGQQWRAVGSQSRRPSQSGGAMPGGGAVTNDTPVFEYFGGRSHGARSFSLSNPLGVLATTVGADQQPATAVQASSDRRMSHQAYVPPHHRMAYRGLAVLEEQQAGFGHDGQHHHQTTSTNNYGGQQQSAHEYSPTEQQPHMHRSRSKSSSHVLRGVYWPGNAVAASAPSSPTANIWQQQQQHASPVSTRSMFGRSNEQRRHSLAPGGLNPPSPMRYSATPDDITADFQHKLSIEGERAVPFEFAEQYGPMIADANVVVTSRGGPRGRAADGKPAHGVHGSGRRRSLSAVSQLSNGEGPYVAYVREPASPLGIITAAGTIKGGELPQTVMEEGETALRGQEWLAVVEFRAGRKDYFYLPEEAPFTVAIGDLVIVEADRGQDLGKVVRLNVTASDAMYESSVSTTATPTTPTAPTPKRIIPKRIVRHAEPSAVKQLVEKARDEKKCLAVVQAKIRQKGMKLEVVDAEYQWDRHKLIFYYVAEERVDFRELVKDLFKIYKTRIWMSAVDRR